MSTLSSPRAPRNAVCVVNGVRQTSVTVLPPVPGGGVHCLITSQTQRGPVTGEYVVYGPLPSDFGDRFAVTKVTSTPAEDHAYDVLLDDTGCLCDCWPALKGAACRHIQACRQLRDQRAI